MLVTLLQQSLAQGQQPSLVVTSNSMAPLLRRGDHIRLEAVTPPLLRPGDIVVIGGGDHLLTHRYWGRLVADDQLWLISRGDRPLAFDEPWPAGRLIGRVVTRRRGRRELCLAAGRGRWLNRQLTWLAAAELRILTGRDATTTDGRRWWQRIVRRLFYGLACLWVAVFVGAAADT